MHRTGNPCVTPDGGAQLGDPALSPLRAVAAFASGESAAAGLPSATPVAPGVVYRPPLPPQQAVGHPAPPADVLSRNLAETTAELAFHDVDDFAGMALGIEVLPDHTANLAFRNPVTLLQNRDDSAAAFRAQKFPVATQGTPHGALLLLRRSLRLEHRLLKLGLLQQLLEPDVLLIQLSQPPGSSACIPPYCCRLRWYIA